MAAIANMVSRPTAYCLWNDALPSPIRTICSINVMALGYVIYIYKIFGYIENVGWGEGGQYWDSLTVTVSISMVGKLNPALWISPATSLALVIGDA